MSTHEQEATKSFNLLHFQVSAVAVMLIFMILAIDDRFVLTTKHNNEVKAELVAIKAELAELKKQK